MRARAARGKSVLTEGFLLEQSQLPPFEEGRIDPGRWFAQGDRPLHVEIGSGKGTFLVQQAPLMPDANFLGVEVAAEFCRHAADRVRRRGIENVRLLHADATEFIRFWCAAGVAAVVHVYFSDPWPKKRHHKRRVIQERTLREIHRILRPGGSVHLVTDHPDLWAWYEEHAAACAGLFERLAFESLDPAGAGELVGTNYERKFAREGRPFFAMTLLRR